jgi:hypothetical protein
VQVSRAAIGFSVHLGWAAAVVVAGTRAKPRVIERRRLTLADDVRESHEPYHKAALVRDDLAQAKAIIRRGTRAIEACARAEVTSLENDVVGLGHRLVGVGILQAGGPELTLESALAAHTMVHVAEGRLMRAALTRASEGRDLPVLAVREKELFVHGAERLKISEKTLRGRVDGLGEGLGPPWGSDQKKAALIAWLRLSGMR